MSKLFDTAHASLARFETAQPAWLVEMHRHFGTHGFYRPSDLDRVLGNPSGHSEGQSVLEFLSNSKK